MEIPKGQPANLQKERIWFITYYRGVGPCDQQQTEPLLGLCVSRSSCSLPSPCRITTQVRLRSARGGFFAGFLGKFWTPRSSSQGSERQSVHVPLLTDGAVRTIFLNNRTVRGFNLPVQKEKQSWHHLQQSSMSDRAEDFLSSFPISFMEFFSCLKCACTFIHMVQNTISDPKYSYLLNEVAC